MYACTPSRGVYARGTRAWRWNDVGKRAALIIIINYGTTSGDRSGGNLTLSHGRREWEMKRYIRFCKRTNFSSAACSCTCCRSSSNEMLVVYTLRSGHPFRPSVFRPRACILQMRNVRIETARFFSGLPFFFTSGRSVIHTAATKNSSSVASVCCTYRINRLWKSLFVFEITTIILINHVNESN